MSTATLYARAIRASLRRSAADDLPSDVLTVPDVTVDTEHLAAYARVCGFDLTNVLPITYPHVLAFERALELQTDPSFPFPAIGTIHVSQKVTALRPILITEPVSLRVFAADLRPHPRGRQYDMVTVASADGEDVWTGRSTYLHRSSTSAVRPDNSSTSEVRPAEPDKSAGGPEPTAIWRLDARLGRRYGAVSGDRNPIHLYRATARLFGFKRQIVHGMWTFAACAAALQNRIPDSSVIRADFKRPILLPGKVGFSASETGDGWTFGVQEYTRKRPLVVGDWFPQ